MNLKKIRKLIFYIKYIKKSCFTDKKWEFFYKNKGKPRCFIIIIESSKD